MAVPPLKIGDFVRNKIHGYIIFLVQKDMTKILHLAGIIIDWKGDSLFTISHTTLHKEIASELEKVPDTLEFIEKAKTGLTKINTEKLQRIDNLTYIELLNILNEKEEELKNEK